MANSPKFPSAVWMHNNGNIVSDAKFCAMQDIKHELTGNMTLPGYVKLERMGNSSLEDAFGVASYAKPNGVRVRVYNTNGRLHM